MPDVELGSKIFLYAADVKILKNYDIFSATYQKISRYRREKVDKLVYMKDKCLSLGAELLLFEALRGIDAGKSDISPDFSLGENGKPYLNGSDGVFFNISHSGDYAVCALSDREIGCDIEKITDIDIALAKRFFCENEYKNIADLNNDQARNELFFRYWTLKESYIKALGLGMKKPLDSFEINLDGGISVRTSSGDGKDYAFAEFDAISGYKCALCVCGNCADAELKMIDLRGCL